MGKKKSEIPSVRKQLQEGLAELREISAGKKSLNSLRVREVNSPSYDSDKIKKLRGKLNM